MCHGSSRFCYWWWISRYRFILCLINFKLRGLVIPLVLLTFKNNIMKRNIYIALILNLGFLIFAINRIIKFWEAYDWRLFASLFSALIFLCMVVMIILSNKSKLLS